MGRAGKLTVGAVIGGMALTIALMAALDPPAPTMNVDLYEEIKAQGWDGVTPISVRATIGADAVIGSTSTAFCSLGVSVTR